jgi:hypothetical protein
MSNEHKKPEEEILIEDLKDLNRYLQQCRTDIETIKNKTKLIRAQLVISRDNLTEAIQRLDAMLESLEY